MLLAMTLQSISKGVAEVASNNCTTFPDGINLPMNAIHLFTNYHNLHTFLP